ncbi:GntR family transcriptional regulator [Paenibacillus physcomitrellae]|uniref:GntR family transcriptional regulator n=1 Tax=Paenibacillus physcomitrellae TaxID=1619311 RepID=A0ABQ1FXU7_9BACL|nr:GntR family transcriptional regulator [Paenibacillus physcomitrellae]GGA31915.1 GntR family transcriptional regulator [Paenibacillus physcomitrellae]
MWIPIQINESSAEPLYHQIETQLRSMIVGGQLAEGTLLPSIRELAGNLNCSAITVRRVYQDLESEGLLRTKQGTGTFVAKVEEEQRGTYKRTFVEEALGAAIDSARSVQYSKEELKTLFLEVLEEKFKDTEKGGDSL